MRSAHKNSKLCVKRYADFMFGSKTKKNYGKFFHLSYEK